VGERKLLAINFGQKWRQKLIYKAQFALKRLNFFASNCTLVWVNKIVPKRQTFSVLEFTNAIKTEGRKIFFIEKLPEVFFYGFSSKTGFK
jgi:hypothetical protein